ncbi:MarR family winged helix-turn-helix transcriptional regulator [Bacillus gobiensis]|uniref:MarR family winged helix-turn-helix transcriptional regulator n=1 Tax=Bacillus gobiensis TaxID=1441095 RepID=UPI003D1B1FB6
MESINRKLFHMFNQAARSISKKTNEQLEEYGLYGSQWTILYCLHKFGPMTQKEIWTYLHVEAPTVTRTIKRLEEKGWIYRTLGNDKREKVVALTEEAVNKYHDIQLKLKEFEDHTLSCFSEQEKEQMYQFILKFTKQGSEMNTK